MVIEDRNSVAGRLFRKFLDSKSARRHANIAFERPGEVRLVPESDDICNGCDRGTRFNESRGRTCNPQGPQKFRGGRAEMLVECAGQLDRVDADVVCNCGGRAPNEYRVNEPFTRQSQPSWRRTH